MHGDNSTPQKTEAEPTLFRATITPNRSLSHRGLTILIALFGAVSFIAGMAFVLMGAWPVMGFFGLDVLLLWWAFRVNNRAAKAHEEVRVTPSRLDVRQVSHRGAVREWSGHPCWTRLDRETHADFGLLGLFLVSRGERVRVAGFLSPPEREDFANALSRALGEARTGLPAA